MNVGPIALICSSAGIGFHLLPCDVFLLDWNNHRYTATEFFVVEAQGNLVRNFGPIVKSWSIRSTNGMKPKHPAVPKKLA